jgi:hypothetical protein
VGFNGFAIEINLLVSRFKTGFSMADGSFCRKSKKNDSYAFSFAKNPILHMLNQRNGGDSFIK